MGRPTNNPHTGRIGCRIPPALKTATDRAARERGITSGEVIRQALTAYLDDNTIRDYPEITAKNRFTGEPRTVTLRPGADLSQLDLSGRNLAYLDLSDANLRWADLSDANFVGTNFDGAALDNAIVARAANTTQEDHQ